MNTPNKLTLLRVLLVPAFMAFQLLPVTKYHLLLALLVFVAASVTDLLDGRLARRNNQVTDFGKLMDPLADKLLVTAALVGFVQLQMCDAWVAMIIIARELLVTSIRLIAVNKGKVIAASLWGKVKTVSQMIAIIATLFLNGLSLPESYGTICHTIGYGLLWAAAIVTILSGIQYTWANREYLSTKSE